MTTETGAPTFIAIAPYYWGSGETPEEAASNCRRAGARKGDPYHLYRATARWQISEIDGTLSYDKGTCEMLTDPDKPPKLKR